MRLLKLSQTAQVLCFLMVDSTDHVSAKTGLSPTVTLSKNGAAFASPAGAVSEISNGWYKVAGNATDTNTLGPLILHASAAGADPVDVEFEVVSYDPQDAAGLGLSRVDVAVSTRNSVAPDNTTITAINAKTTNLPGSPASEGNVTAVGAAVSAGVAAILAAIAALPQTAAAIATAVWASGTRTLTSLGTAAADMIAGVWAAPIRTLTQSAAEVEAAVSGSDLSIRRGDTWSVPLTGLGSIAGRTKLWFTAKMADDQLDSQALVQIEESGGLLYLAGATATDASLGSLVVTDQAAGDLTLTLKPAATQLLEVYGAYGWDVQWLDGSGHVHTLTAASLAVLSDVTRAVA